MKQWYIDQQNEKYGSYAERVQEEPTLLRKLDPAHLKRFSAQELEILTRYYGGEQQVALEKELSVSQPTISHALKRAVRYLRWLSDAPPKPKHLESTLRASLSSENYEIVKCYLETLNQSETAYRIKNRQCHVRSVLVRAKRLVRKDKECLAYLTYFFPIPLGMRRLWHPALGEPLPDRLKLNNKAVSGRYYDVLTLVLNENSTQRGIKL